MNGSIYGQKGIAQLLLQYGVHVGMDIQDKGVFVNFAR